MGRPLRIHYPGALFHVIARGNNQQDIFVDDADRVAFITRFMRLKDELSFQVYAFCLMSNHVHILLRVSTSMVSEIMHRLLTGYSHEFNRRWDKTGHVFQGRFKAIHCARDMYFRELVRYVNMNPVAAGIVDRPERWPWSGYRETVEGKGLGIIDREFVLSMFGSKAEALEALQAFVGRSHDFDPSMIQPEELSEESAIKVHPGPELQLPLETLAAEVGATPAELAARGKMQPLRSMRREFVIAAAQRGHRIAEIARFLRRAESVVCRMVARERRARMRASV